jgi:putative NADPH-quinone reductase
MKKWMDDVFTYWFAYGSTWDKLKWKEFIISTTIGWPKESYTPESFNTYPIDDLLKPLKQTSNLTWMNWNKPIVSHGMVYIPDVYNTQEWVLERAKQHSEELIKKIEVLRNKDSVESK